jgi:hypothetical protein
MPAGRQSISPSDAGVTVIALPSVVHPLRWRDLLIEIDDPDPLDECVQAASLFQRV